MTTVTLQDGLSGYSGTRDTFLSSYGPNTVYGSWGDFFANPSNYTPLVRFAIFAAEGGPVPDGATINSATLWLYKYSNYNLTMTMNRLLRDWVEAQATYNNFATGNAWTTAGAGSSGNDYEATSNCSHTNSNFGTNTWASTDVTTDVAAWAGGTANYGWRFKTTSGGNDRKFYSRDYATDATLRPYLVIDYTDPVTGVEGEASITLGDVTVAAAGVLTIGGGASITLANVTAAGVGSLALAGAAAVTLGNVTSTSTGTLALAGTAGITLGAVSLASAGSLTDRGALAVTLGNITLTATGGSTNTGAAAITLGDVTTASAASLGINAQLGGTLDAVTLAATGSVLVSGAAAVTLGAITLASTGVLGSTVTGTASIALGNVTLASAASLTLAGSAAIALGNVTSAGAGTLALSGSANIVLGSVTTVASGSVAIRGQMLATLGNVTLGATGHYGEDATLFVDPRFVAHSRGGGRKAAGSGSRVAHVPRNFRTRS